MFNYIKNVIMKLLSQIQLNKLLEEIKNRKLVSFDRSVRIFTTWFRSNNGV